MAVAILPCLLPINNHGGRGPNYNEEFKGTGANLSSDQYADVKGLDTLAWGNIRPNKTHRYWAHLVLAIGVIFWVCGVFFAELRVYIKVRQDYLTSAEHRLRASATTVLVSAIPQKWLTVEALQGLYDVFPGGIRNIWINRNFDQLLDKINERKAVHGKLEAAETELIRKAVKAKKKQMAKDEKAAKLKPKTKDEKAQQAKQDDIDAQRLAESGGVSTGDPHQVPHTVDDAIDEEDERQNQRPEKKGTFKIPIIGGGLAAVGQTLDTVGQGFGKAGGTVLGGVQKVGKDLNNQIETTNGFATFDDHSPLDDDYDQYGRFRGALVNNNINSPAGVDDPTTEYHRKDEPDSRTSTPDRLHRNKSGLPGNATRRPTYPYGVDGAKDTDVGNVGWWKFWQPPAGGFASPIPTGYEDGDEFPLTQTDGSRSSVSKQTEEKQPKRSLWDKIMGKEEPIQTDYPKAYNSDYKEDAHGATWETYLKEKDRPHHRLARFSWTPGFLPGIPGISKKVDTIYWCREELARLNLEIEMDQQHPERFPLMNSAFIQFNHQVAAHMAAQAVTHHVPKHMAPRTVEIAPTDVIWGNMSITWWEAWIREAIVISMVAGMIILWAFPVAWTATLAQLPTLVQKYSWLHWLSGVGKGVLSALAGVLPALVLGILLALVPMILRLLAKFGGAQTGTEREENSQIYYFAFLFVQVFLVVSISGGAISAIANANEVDIVTKTLAQNLPKASNYFFSYMILQALSTSSGTLLQTVTLVLWFLLPKIQDNTARQKWSRNTSLPDIKWGTFFPIYTNFACIALVYCVIAPLIIVFAIITFTLLWIAHRYNMLYVSRFVIDTGGLLYPRAINQTFTGLYFMELSLVGLFFLVRDENDKVACAPQAIIMVIFIFLTALYQILLNYSFGPLFRHLPITFEDEAVLRDEAFERAQAHRLGLDEEEEVDGLGQQDGSIEMSRLHTGQSKLARFNPVNAVQEAGSWATKSGRRLRNKTFGRGNNTDNGSVSPHPHLTLRHKRRSQGPNNLKAISDALFDGYHDEIEDLTPDERDVLVKHAFQHEALRARRPTVWIPRDGVGGVSDDEIRRTREFAGDNIWITNIGAGLDSKARVIYAKNPPDFSEVDLINL